MRRLLANLLVRVVGRAWDLGEAAHWRWVTDRYRRRYDVHPTFKFRTGSRIYGSGEIDLGARSYIGTNTHLQAGRGCALKIGVGCRIGPNVRMYTRTVSSDDDFSEDPDPVVGNINIGDYVWIGAGAFVAQGVTIGDNAVVGANSVVNRDVKAFEIVAGVPIRHLRYKASRRTDDHRIETAD